MKNFILAILLLLLVKFTLNAQTLKGRVFVSGTDSSIVAYASIYFDGMHKGTTSDDKGFFKINLSDSGKSPLIVSAVGYNSATITDYSPAKNITIYLIPKTYNLNTVTIKNDGMSRKEKETIFKKEFIGTSVNASNCEIINIDEIKMVYTKKTNTLEAFSDQPILIQNIGLGYKITYYLNEFVKKGNNVSYNGNHFFEEDSLLKTKELKKIIKRREAAYPGSRMHFIRSLWNNKLEINNFRITNNEGNELNFDNIIISTDSTKAIRMESPLKVIYQNNYLNTSYLYPKKQLIYIDKKGFFTPDGFSISGYLSKQRVGDLLPFEYVYKKEK